MRKFQSFYQKQLFRQWLMAALLFLSLGKQSVAGIDPPVVGVLTGTQGQIAEDSFVTVEDAKFFDPDYYNLLMKPYPVQNVISVEINEDYHKLIPANFEATVRLEISYVLNDSTTNSFERDFTVSYDSIIRYDRKAVYVGKNYVRVTVKIVQLTKNVGWDVWEYLKITNQLTPMPLYEFDCTLNAIQTINDSAWAPDTDMDELPVYWSHSIGADEYDLEWTYIDSSALANGRYGNPQEPDPDLLFENNASRVTITGTYYKIPLLYDNKGHLFFRVRPVQWQPGGGRSEGDWSSGYTNGLGKFDYNGHERSLNWQATTTYAEEGKRKTVIQYFDGSLRSRQTVTKDNSTYTTIVAESFYDYQGRPVVQVLPAPTMNTIIQYNHGFNVGLNSNIYDKYNYDTLADPELYCNVGAAQMDTVSGAARYYSPNNPLVDSGFHKYIPDAHGYPFTEVEYTQDNTGRISRQSGVGPTHRIGSGHETKYFYGTPDQRELDALFGTEVGDASHYFKTMVRDANGQYSVSYTDMHGRTIATALAGVPPDSIRLDTLASYSSLLTTESLSDPSSVIIKDLVMENRKGLLVEKAGNHTFTYKLDPQTLQKEGCTTEVCYECLYDLQITITDDCNNQKLGGSAWDTVVTNFSIGSIDTFCSENSGGFTFSFTKFLEEGSYEITKSLSVSRYGLDYYRDSIFLATNTCKTLDSFINEQRLLLAESLECTPTCESCIDSLGTEEEFWQEYRVVIGITDPVTGITDPEADTVLYKNMAAKAWAKAKEECALLCDSTSEYNDIRTMMLTDMTPSSGQYADVNNVNDIYSIFYSNTGTITPKYQQVQTYLDEDGNPDKVYDEKAGTLVYPWQLSQEAFAQKFKLSWAEALLSYHPEYCKLEKYEELKASHKWDRRFAATDTWAEAMEKGYLNPTNSNSSPFTNFTGTGVIDSDPMASYNSGQFKGSLELGITQFINSEAGYFSMWSVASVTVMCEGTDTACYNTYKNTSNAFDTTLMCAGELNMAWRAFRQMYLDKKRTILNTWINQECISSPTAATIVAAGHQPHFGDAETMLDANGIDLPVNESEATAFEQEYEGVRDQYYVNNCTSYATLWWSQLAPCNFSQADSARVVSRLVQICVEGSDDTHPYGSSDIRPGSSYTFDSFEEFLEHYCDSMNISYDTVCNAYLITAPKPYNQQAVYGNKPIYSRPDTCECNTIAAYYNKFTLSPYTSFSEFMQEAYNTSISDSVLNILRGFCDIGELTPPCPVLEQPIYLPPAFQCNTGDICVTCDQIKALDLEFRLRFPGGYPDSTNTDFNDSAQLRWNQLYADFMNYKLGFTKSTDEYLEFLNACPGGNTCTELRDLANLFYFTFINPASRVVELDMRTLAGNKTPKEGPKGVFDVNGNLIGQTISGTPAQIDSSFAAIWNSSVPNQTVGTLQPLPNGRFSLQLNSGQQAPCNGLIGMRYYQFDTHVKDTMQYFGTSIGSYVDFGDSTSFVTGRDTTNSHTLLDRANGLFNYYQVKKILGNDYKAFSQFRLTHIYPSTPYRTTYTVTVYHTDTIGSINFHDSRPNGDSTQFSNMRGYWPQHLLELRFGGTRDSTINRSREIINFEQISSIRYIEFRINKPPAGQLPAPFLFNNFGSFANNHGLRYFRLDPDYEFIPNYEQSGVVDAVAGKQFSENFPDFNINFPDVRFMYIAGWDKREDDISHFNFELPKLRVSEMAFFELPTGFVDSFYNQVARVTTIDSPAHIFFSSDTFATVTAASADARSYLIGRGWKLNHHGLRMGTIGAGPDDLVAFDSIPMITPFTEYFNQRLGTNFYWQQLKDYFISNCGSVPDFCNFEPDSLAIIRDEYKNIYFNFGHKYDQNGCDTTTWRVNYSGTYIGYPVSYSEVFATGAMQFPDTLGINGVPNKIGYDFVWRDSACVERRFALEFKMRQDHFRRLGMEMWFMNRGDSIRKFYFIFDSTSLNANLAAFYDYTLVENNREYKAVSEFRQDYSDWRVLKFQVIDSVLKFYLDGNLLRTFNFPSGLPVEKFYGFGIGSMAHDGKMSAEFDYVKCYDKNGTVFYYDSFNDCVNRTLFEPFIRCPRESCPQGFTKYFNQVRGTSYTYNQIDSLYAANNVLLNVCDSTSSILTLCGRSEPTFAVGSLDVINNCSDSAFFIQSAAQELYKVYRDSLINEFDSSYIARCMQAYQYESFTVRRTVSQFHHTLYYYDQAGNLIKTVPPAGVHANYDSLWLDSVYTARLAGESKVPEHTLVTQYRYNTLNQVVAQNSPDGGHTEFWYDRLGRLVLSRNARQLARSEENYHLYSYTRYDHLGRITEVGQLRDTAEASFVNDDLTRNQESLEDWFGLRQHYRHQVTQTVYDEPYFTGPYDPQTMAQRNLRNRVSYVSYSDTTGSAVAYNSAVFYSYDIHGNVDTLLNDYGLSSTVPNIMNVNGNRWKKIVYKYDLISGKVNLVMYQPGYTDRWYHRYTYDADNRLILAETSYDSAVWETEARYEYYKHGPLARVVIGHQQVQGVDYAYTLQGWLKGINSTGATLVHDMGGDGTDGGANQYTARDALGLTLNYFAGEYTPVNSGVNPFPAYSAYLNNEYRPLYNGNISSMSVYNRQLTNHAGGALTFSNYHYDQLNRYTGMDVYRGLDTLNNTWSGIQIAADSLMKERVSYDANGNILTYLRNAAQAWPKRMDELTYSYYPGTNRLRRIRDVVDSNHIGSNSWEVILDIDDQLEEDNYVYDEIGNLVQDKAEQITGINWNVYGKITEINRIAEPAVDVSGATYTYDALGNRIGKVYDFKGTKNYVWYVRDAQGNVLSTYTVQGNGELDSLNLSQSEVFLYGSSRIGVYNEGRPVDFNNSGPGSTEFYSGNTLRRDYRQYELTNHLGNVLATISDRKYGVSSGGSLIDFYNPDIVSANDYYPFGMPSRLALSSTGVHYRFGFNGKEHDSEAKGWENQVDYGMRVYDPRAGRFLSVDPLTAKYPWYTPYQFAGNIPITFIDIDGLEPGYPGGKSWGYSSW